jgi:hypothetical protein
MRIRDDEQTKITYGMRVPRSLITDLEEIASFDGRSVANLIRKVLEDFLDTVAPVQEQTPQYPGPIAPGLIAAKPAPQAAAEVQAPVKKPVAPMNIRRPQ